jgi:5,10-methylenetetrahydromethanopterin reductase
MNEWVARWGFASREFRQRPEAEAFWKSAHEELQKLNLVLMFFSVLKMSIDDIVTCSVAAEEAGFSHITVAESFYRDGFALASAIASNTNKVNFGTSVIPIYTRTPFQIAMGVSTLNEISHGRMRFLGLGVGYRNRTEQYFGIKQAQRLERMREYVEIIKQLLSGADVTYHGKLFNLQNFPKLTAEPLDIPIYFGSSAPKMLELAGKVAEGVILNSISTPEYVKFARERIADGAKSVGRDPAKTEIGHSIIYAVAEDTQKAIEAAKEDILFYLSYPELDPIIEKSSFGADVLKIRQSYMKGDKETALSLISSEMLDTFSVYGTPGECRARLRKFVGRGVTLPIIRVSMASNENHQKKAIFLRAVESLRGWRPQDASFT